MKRFAILSFVIAIALTAGVGYNSNETEKHPTYQASVIQDELQASFEQVTVTTVAAYENVHTFNLVVPEQLVPKPFTFYVAITRVNIDRPNARPPNV